jgi:hypothetical protein
MATKSMLISGVGVRVICKCALLIRGAGEEMDGNKHIIHYFLVKITVALSFHRFE